MKLNILLRFYLLLGCGQFISCLYVQGNFEPLDNSSRKDLEKIKYPKKLDNYLEKNRNKRYRDVNGRSFKIFKNFHFDKELPNMNYKRSAGPNKISEMKILRKVDYYLPNSFSENKNENFTPKTLLGTEGKEYNNIKSYNHLKNPGANRIRRESPQIFGYTGSTETKKRISSADKFLILDEKERERLLEKVLNEINRKLNKPEFDKSCIENHESVEVKPQLLILNSKLKPKRDKNSETEPSVSRTVENSYSSKTYAETHSTSFNDATETVISPDLKTNRGISSIGKQTGRNNVNTEQFTTNSKNLSKREDTQYQTEDIHLTTLMPEAIDQDSSMKKPVEMRRVNDNKSKINNDEITTDQSDNVHLKEISPSPSGKSVKQRNKNGQPQLYQILRNPSEVNKFGHNEGPSDSSKISEKMNNNYGEDDELLEYIKNRVKNCLQGMRKDIKEEKEKPETKDTNREEEKNETTSDTRENYPKEISPELIKQLSLFERLNSLNPNSAGFQLLWNILQSTPSKPNIPSGENQKAHAENVSPYKSPLMAEENYLDEISSEENGNESYDMILQTDLKNLNDFARTFTKPNMEPTRFDRFWGTDLLEELFL